MPELIPPFGSCGEPMERECEYCSGTGKVIKPAMLSGWDGKQDFAPAGFVECPVCKPAGPKP
jgi:hypothetical protein